MYGRPSKVSGSQAPSPYLPIGGLPGHLGMDRLVTVERRFAQAVEEEARRHPRHRESETNDEKPAEGGVTGPGGLGGRDIHGLHADQYSERSEVDCDEPSQRRRDDPTPSVARRVPTVPGLLVHHPDPGQRAPGGLFPDEEVVGVWKSSRVSQLGPARMRFDLRCDCTYESKVGLLSMRIREEGYYRVGEGEIDFLRPEGGTEWPYELRDGKLLLTEAPGEVHEYRRSTSLSRAGGGPPARQLIYRVFLNSSNKIAPARSSTPAGTAARNCASARG